MVHDLAVTGWVVHEVLRPGEPRTTHNAAGDPYTTDGKVAILELANIAVTPFSTELRGPAARATRVIAPALRWRLPKHGRARAAQIRQSDRKPRTT